LLKRDLLEVNPASKIIACSLALTAFVVAVLSGLLAANSATTVLLNALVCTVLCQFLGLGIGMVFERISTDAIQSYQKRHPIPTVDEPAGGVDRALANVGVDRTTGG
jgi:nitrate/nitrite transporter NarK